MGLTITQKADTLGTFRFMCVRMMEMLAEWVPTSPELEVKTLFGRHIWTFAQHADTLGRRTVELRAKLHYDRPPQGDYQAALETVRKAAASGNRIAGFYDALLPDVASRFQEHLAQADDLLDAPTVEIVRRALTDFERMQNDRRHVSTQRPDLVADPEWIDQVRRALAACDAFVEPREGAML